MRRLTTSSLYAGVLTTLLAAGTATAQSGNNQPDPGHTQGAPGPGDQAGSAAGQQEKRAYQQHVQSRIQDYEDRIRDLEQAAAQLKGNAQKDVNNVIKDMRGQLAHARQKVGDLKSATGKSWSQVHDDLEKTFHQLQTTYRNAFTRTGQAGQEQTADLLMLTLMLPSNTDYSQHVLTRLKNYEERVDAMQKASMQNSEKVQEDVKDAAQGLREMIYDTTERARALRRTQDPDEWAELHDDIENALRDIQQDYTNALAMLPPQQQPSVGAAGDVNPGVSDYSRQVLQQLEQVRGRLDQMEQRVTQMSGTQQENVLDGIKDIRERVYDTAERARAFDRATEEEEKRELRGDIDQAMKEIQRDMDKLGGRFNQR